MVGNDVAARAERLQLTRRSGPLARLADDGRGRADVGFAAGLLPALARDRHQLRRGDLDNGPAEQATAAGLTGAAQWPQRVGVDGDAVLWPGVA